MIKEDIVKVINRMNSCNIEAGNIEGVDFQISKSNENYQELIERHILSVEERIKGLYVLEFSINELDDFFDISINMKALYNERRNNTIKTSD